MANMLFERLRAGDAIMGFCTMYPAPGIIECTAAHWDWVWIDSQHGEHSYDSVINSVRTARASGIASIVRPETHDHGILGKYADIAPDGMMIPMVDTPEQAESIVQALRFPPRGSRSYGGRRLTDLGGREAYRETELLVMAQIETVEAAQNAEAIAATDGIDALFFGPDDMKCRLGLPINTPPTESDQLREAMESTAAAAKAAGKFCGCIGANRASLKMALEMGYQIIVGGADVIYLRESSAAFIEQVKDILGRKPGPATGGGQSAY